MRGFMRSPWLPRRATIGCDNPPLPKRSCSFVAVSAMNEQAIDFANSIPPFLHQSATGAIAKFCFENSAPTLPLCDRLLRLRRLLLGLNGDDIAQTLQPALEVGGGAGLIELIKIRLAELAIADAAAEHVIGRH